MGDCKSMIEKRNRQVDVLALTLVALTLFVGVSLLTYSKADPPGQLAYPPVEQVQNACGRMGASTAHLLFGTVGLGAYFVLGSLAVVATLLLARRNIDQPAVRTVGWLLSLASLTALAAILLPNSTPGPLVGAGGYLGAMGRSWLEGNFAYTGSLLFLLSVLAAGLLLSTDYWVFHLAAKTTQVSSRGLATLGQAASKSLRPRTDLEGGIASELTGSDADAEKDEAEEYEYEDEEEWAEEEHEEEEGETELKVRTPTSKESPASKESKNKQVKATTKEAAEEKGGALRRVASKLTSALAGEPSEEAEAAAAEEEPESPPPLKKPKPKSEREEIIEQLQAADQGQTNASNYELPAVELLEASEEVSYEEHEKEVRRKAKILEKTFKNFGFNVKVVEIETGPVIAQYEIALEAGLRLSKITGLADDLAIALRVPSVRIVAPIPGKNTVGIEVPNENRQLVRLREVIEQSNGKTARMKIPIYLGKDVSGNPMVIDLASLPHLLIAGRTGTGKSVCLNSIIVSMLMTRGPDEVRMLMIDPKMVELSGYRKLPHLMHPVVTDMKKAEAILAWAVDKMEERYSLLARAGVRHVSVYNQLGDEELRERVQPTSEGEWEEIPRQLPFIVIIADEMADLMMTAGKDVEQHIIRLAQKSRAVGIHLILATQKPTVDVITGLIKSNLPARLAFQVASRTDSRVVLDEMGADKLLGNGDMLFLSPGTSMVSRGQGTFLSDDEITRVVDFAGTEEPQFAGELMQLKTKEEVEATAGSLKNRDEMYEAAIEVVVREGRGSVSLLQRSLGIGYGRAARLIDFMAEDSIVGQYNGSQAREVTLTMDDWEAMRDGEAGDTNGEGTIHCEPSEEANSQVPPTSLLDSATPVPAVPAVTNPKPKLQPKRANRVEMVEGEEETLEEESSDPQSEELAPWEEDDLKAENAAAKKKSTKKIDREAKEEQEWEEYEEAYEDDEEADEEDDEEWEYEEEEDEGDEEGEKGEGDDAEDAEDASLEGEEDEWEYEEEGDEEWDEEDEEEPVARV